MILSGNINRFFDKAISRHTLTIEESGRRKLLVVFFLMIIPADIIFGTILLLHGFATVAVMDYILAIIMTFIVFILRYINNSKPVYRIVLLLYSLALIYFIKTGAANGYASIWAMFQPVFAYFLLGEKEGSVWIAIFTAAAFSLLINPYSYLSGFAYSPEFTSRFIPTYFMILIFTYSYENARCRYKIAMETEQANLHLEKERLAESKSELERAYSLLKDEMKVREQAEIELRRHRDHLEDIVAERTLELKKNNDKLEASEKSFRLIADNTNDVIWSMDLNRKFTFISPSAFRIYGYTLEEIMTSSPIKWHTPDSYRRMTEAFLREIERENKGGDNPLEYIILQQEHIKKDGTVFPVEMKASFIRDQNGKATGIVGITRDISERIAMEEDKEKIKEQLAQSQKMEAMGTLVGGLAHDFNNFLGGIIGSFDLLSLALKDENLAKKDYIEKYLRTGMESSKRSAGLINQLLILSKKHEVKLLPLNINDSLNHIYEICRNSFPKSIELDFNISENPLIIMGDMVQIEQVFLNLCINASHAMTIMHRPEEKHGGTLSVTSELVKSDYSINKIHPDHRVRVTVADTGVGMDNETKQRIFEPFFSTKKESTGLGLAISYNIIKKHGGILNVYSEPGSGSSFSIYFPFYGEIDKIPTEDSKPGIVYGNGTVLIIDDEPSILDIAEVMLKNSGYDVITAKGADAGIEIYRKEHRNISAILLDLSMPGKSGLEVFTELQKTDPNVKVILSSGMLSKETREAAFGKGVKETINKPYMASELSMKIKKIINEK